ncbi:MAG: hypothetical protein ACI4QM_04210 [Alphaproteobacteria bacterium]
MPILHIELSDQLLKRLEKQAYLSDESVEEFVLSALEDAVSLWEDCADTKEEDAETVTPLLYA